MTATRRDLASTVIADRKAMSMDWAGSAACYGVPTDVFYGGTEDHSFLGGQQKATAKKICEGCPVLAECRDWALATAEPWGVWGGLTAAERAHILGFDGVLSLVRAHDPRRRSA